MARLGQFRGDTLENWKKENAIIPDREFILIASDASKPTTYDFWACGDGITHFEDLPMNGNGGGSGGAMTVLQGLGDNTESPMSQEAVTRYISEYIVSNYHTNPATGKNVFTALEAINLVPIYIRRLGLKCGFLTLVDPTQEITRLVMIQYIGKSLSESDWTNLNNWSSLDIQVESTLTVFIFKISPTEPATPVGGYWNTEANIVVYPEGWTGTDFSSEGDIVWMSVGIFGADGNLKGEWSKPIRITGETGPAGKNGVNGSQGVAGIPGVDIELRFSLGTDTTYDANWNSRIQTDRDLPASNGWSLEMPVPTASKLYIWLIQARIAHQVNGDAGTLETGSWSEPIRLNGINGLPGPQGKKGQVVYPAGVYGNTVSYTTTETKAPYVYDPSDGNFYVLNAIMTWLGTEQNNRTPSQSYAESQGLYWLKFDAYEAIYAKIGIIANGLIGSAVFNGNYMFSQQGTDANGNPSSNYEEFTGGADSPFKPNLLINFNTGDLTYKGVSQILAYHMEENERLDINNEFPYNKIVAAEGCTIGFKNSNRYNPRRIEVEGVCTYNYALTGTYVNNVKLDTSLEYVKIMESITIEYPADGQIYAYNTPDLFTKTGRFGEFSIVANNMVGVTTANTIFGSQNVAQIMFSNNTAGIVVLKNDERRVLYPFDISTVLPVRLSRASLDYVKAKWWDVQAQLQIRRNTSNTANEVSFVVQYPSEVRNLEDDVISCSGQLLVVG